MTDPVLRYLGNRIMQIQAVAKRAGLDHVNALLDEARAECALLLSDGKPAAYHCDGMHPVRSTRIAAAPFSRHPVPEVSNDRPDDTPPRAA